ncbi:MAG: hypothetical protein VE96_C0004G0010 [candidate division Kazan bacterium GW2011_GWA1_44_22]|uniref:Uncharacterized protein n=1 Tax=candidate division Kazan bacterium GW2011_GWA1_44_22 TaxID=1620410 RepID=A0A0G1I2E7_UNCK3|nr:MAG: hypothetical protein VE96_C0004G0010 [candidate division Kazan bacterium GW2011_GWA1_44_22]
MFFEKSFNKLLYLLNKVFIILIVATLRND